jgi:hypothetical protein
MPKKEQPKGRSIKGKTKADIRKLTVASNQKKDGLTAELDLDITVTEKQCAKLFGDDFARLAFGQMMQIEVDDGTETIHLAKSITAGKRFRLAKHVMTLDGYEVIAQPKLKKIHPVEKSDRVVVSILMPIHVGEDESLGGRLVAMTGESIEMHFSPAQMDLPAT